MDFNSSLFSILIKSSDNGTKYLVSELIKTLSVSIFVGNIFSPMPVKQIEKKLESRIGFPHFSWQKEETKLFFVEMVD